jgi:signal transduction histidine kinase
MPADRDQSADPGGSIAGLADAAVPSDAARPSAASPHLRDLAALLALPRMWRDRDPAFIVGSLLDVLVSLLRVDVAYVHLACGREESIFERGRARSVSVPELRDSIEKAFTVGAGGTPTMALPGTADLVRLLRVPAQLDDQTATVVVGSIRPDFPNDPEVFLSSVAVEQALLAVHASRLVSKLSAANAAKSTFLATMSHELRTPLNAVIGYSELLLGRISGDLNAQQSQHVTRIDSAARHLLGLIESILSFARLEAGKEQVRLSETDAVTLAEEVVALVEPLATARGLALHFTPLTRPQPIRTDSAKVRQILLNLLSNAVKFTSEGQITVDARSEGSSSVWTVTDTGGGIAAEDLESIFEPFRQITQGQSRAPGTGLGLSVSRQLARLLGGDVMVRSILKEGSTFELRLPRVASRLIEPE